jgi:hypothetical protein
MPGREESLRRIFEATGVSARLTDEQKAELLTHLEDAVETKVAAGVPEMEAVGQAFTELGDLEKIARQFPTPAPVAVTPEGIRVLGDTRNLAWIALAHVGFFAFLSWFVTPRFAEVFRQVRVPLPGITLLFVKLGDLLRSSPLVPLGALLLLVVAIGVLRRKPLPAGAAYVLLVISVALCLGLAAGLFLPLISLLEGIGARR